MPALTLGCLRRARLAFAESQDAVKVLTTGAGGKVVDQRRP
jgi:hypothetical protein